MKCNEIPLPELIRGELPESAVAAIQVHLDGCRLCRERARVMAALETAGAMPIRPGRSWMRVAAVAALLLLALSLAALLRSGSTIPSASGRAAGWATGRAYPFIGLSVRGALRTSDHDRMEAFAAYRRGDYRAAARWFARSEGDGESDFYLGVSLYLLDEPEAALTPLIEAAETQKWREAALWYRANALLKLDRLPEARRQLETVAQEGGEFAEEAEDLLRRLDTL
ncbi:MAG: hypothetical protein WAO20_08435 [Acidobacteriota bacterium]